MKINITGFIYHKTAEDFSDCFDRYAINPENNRFSIADGVSKSFFPGIWAELLVNTYVNAREEVNFNNAEILLKIQNEWLEKVKEIVNKPNQKYFVRNRFNQGGAAAATFVGLSFFKDNSNKYKWEAYALGDSFLFFIPDNSLDINEDFESKVNYLSSKKNLEFDNYPDFFESRNDNHKGKIQRKEGQMQAGIFYLMTDALAEWFIKETESARGEIHSWKNQHDFEIRIEKLRKSVMNNDDSAILVIRIEDDKKDELIYVDHSISNIDEFILKEKEEQQKNVAQEEVENIKVEDESVNTDTSENGEQNIKTEIQEPLNEKEGVLQKVFKNLTEKF